MYSYESTESKKYLLLIHEFSKEFSLLFNCTKENQITLDDH